MLDRASNKFPTIYEVVMFKGATSWLAHFLL